MQPRCTEPRDRSKMAPLMLTDKDPRFIMPIKSLTIKVAATKQTLLEMKISLNWARRQRVSPIFKAKAQAG